MPVQRPNATTVSLSKDVVRKCKDVAESLDMNTKDFMDALLTHALAQSEITLETKTIVVKQASLAKKGAGRK